MLKSHTVTFIYTNTYFIQPKLCIFWNTNQLRRRAVGTSDSLSVSRELRTPLKASVVSLSKTRYP